MNSGLLAKASFALLLLIFGCLVYMIARERRLDQLARESAAQAASENRTRAVPLAQGNTPEAPPQTEKPEYAPLRPRSTPAPVATAAPSPARPLRPSAGVEFATRPVSATSALPLPAEVPDATFAAFAGNNTAAATSNSSSATVTGQVFLRGTPPAEKQIALDPTCGRLHSKPITTRHYVVGEAGGLANVFVYVKSGSVAIGPPVAQSVLLDQAGCQYQPYVLGVQVNQPLVVRNSDPLLHNVHSQSKYARERNVAQANRGMTATFSFQRPEVFVRFRCDVHPWMFAFVGVVDHPWFAVTDKDGKFSLPQGLSAGRYTLAAAHPKSGELTQDISISEGMEPITFTFDAAETLASPAGATGQAAVR